MPSPTAMPINRLRPHPQAVVVPPLSEAEFDALRADIEHRGILVPLCVTGTGTVLCGHHRLKAAQQLGITSVPVLVVEGLSLAAEIEHLVLDNVNRRHLTPGQRAALLTAPGVSDALRRACEEDAHRRMAAGGRKGGKRGQGVATLPPPSKGKTRDQLGRLAGVSGRTVSDAIYAWEQAPARMEAILAGASDETVGRLAVELRRAARLTPTERAVVSAAEDFERLFGPVQRFDVWRINQETPTPGFGDPWPGNIPAAIVANAIYYLTEPDDLVVDPCAGGAVTGDVCRAMGRRVVLADVRPSRPEVVKHAIERGPVPGTEGKAMLVFVDPPYWTMRAADYGPESASALDWSGWTRWLDALALSSYIMLQPGGRVAVLMADVFAEGAPFVAGRSSVAASMESLGRAGLLPVTTVSVPMTTQVKGAAFEWAEKGRRLLGINRLLLVFQKPM